MSIVTSLGLSGLALVGAVSLTPQDPAATDQVSLHPSSWPQGDVEHYLGLNGVYGDRRAGTQGKSLMIGGTSGAFAVHAGLIALERGGTAMDAALTTALAQTTLVGGSWVSFAGMLYAVYYDAATQEVYCLNAGFDTLKEETEPESIPSQPTPSGRTVLVPGFMTGVEVAHRRFGRLPFRELFEPSIFLAAQGFPVDAVLAGLIASRRDVLSRRPDTRSVFEDEAGELLEEGDLFRQPALARTLRRVALEGSAYMREGQWAEKLVQTVREEGGRLTREDLAGYRTAWEAPITTSYHDHVVATIPPPELGSTMLLESLNLLEESGVTGGAHYAEDTELLYRFIQIARLGYLLSYSPGYVPHPEDARDGLLLPATRISSDHALDLFDLLEEEGWERSWEARLYTRFAAPAARASGSHSDAVVSVDAAGNVCALVHSINTTTWGTTGLFVDGVSIPDAASFQQYMIGRTGPGRRLPNVTNPCLVLDQEGRCVLAAAVIGSALHECMLQNLVNILDFGMEPQESVDRPKFWGPHHDPANREGFDARHTVETALGRERIDALIERGQEVMPIPSGTSFFVGIRIAGDGLSGGGTQRFNGRFEAR